MEPNTRQLKEPSRNPITNPVSFLKAIVGTMMDAHDKYHVTKTSGDLDRTIGISTVVNINGRTREIKTTDFDITREESTALFQNGVEDGKRFLSAWDFGKWKQAYRGMVAPPAGSAWTVPAYLIIGRTRRAGGC